MSARVPLALDSGAHSLFNRYIAVKNKDGSLAGGVESIGKANYDYIKSDHFKKYLADYMAWLKQHSSHLEFSVTLDLIYNPEDTWAIYQEFKQAGICVLPVYHYGEDPKWLKKYIEDTDYIGVGGLGQHATKQSWLPFGERTWKIICDGKGRPRVKVHGFAMSSFDLVQRWPWYSVDSTTAFTFSRYGAITLPNANRTGKGFNYATNPQVMFVTNRTGHHERHVGKRWPDGIVQRAVHAYLEEAGLGYSDVADPGTEGHAARDAANLFFMNKSMAQISADLSDRLNINHAVYYYASGSPSGTMPGFLAGIDHLAEIGQTEHLCYLGTFFQGMRRPINYLLETWCGVKP